MTWYQSLTVAEKIYFYIAIVGTVLLVVQIIMMLFSFGGGADADGDADFGGDGEFDAPDGGLGISLFTLKGITAFLAIGGWVGLLILQINSANIALVHRACPRHGLCYDVLGCACHEGNFQIAERRYAG